MVMKSPYTLKKIPVTAIVDLFLTYDCNMRCPYCFVQDSGKKVTMSPDVLDTAIDWIVTTSGPIAEIVFLGGEPTLTPLLIERAIARVKNWERRCPIKISFNMTTNALYIDETLAANFARWGVNYMISIDGYGKRQDRSRPTITGESSFEIFRSKFDMLLKYQNSMAGRVTVLPKNVVGLNNDLQRLHAMGFSSFIVSPATGIKWSDKQINKYIGEMVDFASQRKSRNGKKIPYLSPVDDPDQGEHGWGCSAGNGRYSIDPQGKIFACGRMTSLDDDAGLVFGDIYEGIDPKGNILKFQDRSYESRLQCIDCYMRDKCIGGCAAVNFEETGSVVTPSANECRFAKAVEEIKSKTRHKAGYN